MTIKILDKKNAFYDAENGRVEIEINQEGFGWLPTSIPVDSAEEHHLQILAELDLNNLPKVSDILLSKEELLVEKVYKIKALRTAALRGDNATVTDSNGLVWQVNKSTLEELNKLISLTTLAGAVPEGTVWRDQDNVNHPATIALLLEIALRAGAREKAIWAASWALLDGVRSLETAQEVRDFVIPESL